MTIEVRLDEIEDKINSIIKDINNIENRVKEFINKIDTAHIRLNAHYSILSTLSSLTECLTREILPRNILNLMFIADKLDNLKNSIDK